MLLTFDLVMRDYSNNTLQRRREMLLTFDFKTVEEAQEFLAGLMKKPASVVTVYTALGDPAETYVAGPVGSDGFIQDAPAIEALKSAVEKKKRGPKPKAEKAAEEKVYGIEDCRAALSALFDSKGRDAAKAALAEFKVARIGELKADQYRGFIVMCGTLGEPE